MHQAASFISSILLSPLNWIILLLISAYFFRKSVRKKFFILAIIIFIVFSNGWLLNWYAEKWQPAPVVLGADSVYSCGIVLGGFASSDANENGYFNPTADRFIQVVKLYKLGNIKHILINGGNGKRTQKNFREGAWVKGELIAVGIPDSVIFIEDRSNNTFDNAQYAKQILDSVNLKPPYILITSALHMPRASFLFKSAGISVVSFPCNYLAGRGTVNLSGLFPQFSTLTGWEGYLKEATGLTWYKLKYK